MPSLNIPSGIFSSYIDGVNYLIDEPNIGRDLTLVYEVKEPRSTNTYSNTFVELDTETVVTTERIRARVYHTPRNWIKTSTNVEFVNGRIQIMGRWEDVDNLRRCSRIELDTGVRYKLATDPVRHGFTHDYYIAFLDLL